MDAPIVVGVRHHSPACARLVAHVIEEVRPRFVLIEGPADMNDRLGELRLPHRLPVAIYTYRLEDDGRRARGTWCPMCDYSPEWIALQRGHAAAADVRFIDLPAWDDAFAETENRYSDAHLSVSARLADIAESLGFDSTDTLWDHLFEQPKPAPELAHELAEYFTALRADEPARDRDDRREAYMARWMAWAMAEAHGAPVVVVCGGFHKPALERLWREAPPTLPGVELPADRVGSYLVPFSFHRLDSFTGYASGMPSPAFYQQVWERGADAIDTMMLHAVQRLRSKGQAVSTADAIAASQLTRGLALLRGHSTATRADVLDGLLGALVKDALTTPAPWSIRGTLPRGTDPMLVEIIAAFSGEARGELAPGTPRPPLLHDIEAELRRVGLAWAEKARTVRIDPFDPAATGQRRVLYRLAILAIPGVARTAAADLRRGATRVAEEWQLEHLLETEPAVIECAVYGATLEQAAAARVLELLEAAEGIAPLVAVLERAVFAGYDAMAHELSGRAHAAVERETVFAELGTALEKLLAIQRAVPDPTAATQLGTLVAQVAERALWLLEAITGPRAAFARADVRAVAALRDALREPATLPAGVRTAGFELLERRTLATDAPPAIRGAALGALWSVNAAGDEATATRTTRAIETPALGDFLSGLFFLAREEFLASSLLGVVDARLRLLDPLEFLAALPALRHAFAFFPPRERLAIAKQLLRARGIAGDAVALLGEPASPDLALRGARLEQAVLELADHYRLLDGDR
jgi:hypothetical protein